jgi:hypothetical protein
VSSGGDGGNCTRVRKVRPQVTTSLASLCALARTDSTSGVERASRVKSRQPLPAWRLPNPDSVTPNAHASGEHGRRRRDTSRGPSVSRYWLTPRAEEPQGWCECSHLDCSCFNAGRIRGLPPAISPPRRTYSSPYYVPIIPRNLTFRVPSTPAESLDRYRVLLSPRACRTASFLAPEPTPLSRV